MSIKRWGNILFYSLLLGSLLLGCDGFLSKKQGFTLLKPDATGIDFRNDLEETHEMNIISYPDFYSGGGVSIGDIDNDGLSDVFFTGNQAPARLYRNLGDLKFEDITESAGLDKMGRGWYTGTCMVDINNDGYLDIYISKSGMESPDDRANLLFVNNQDGTFTERAKEIGLDNQGFGVNAVFFDYDKDGDLDAYVSNQAAQRLTSSDANRLRNEIAPYAGDKLYENVDGHFKDVTEEAGVFSSVVGFAHGAAVGDINDDGWEDFFVSNDFFEFDYMYLNNGDKTFREVIKQSTKHTSHFSMGNDLADFDNDGLLDLVVLDMVAEGNRRLYENTGGNDEKRFQGMIKNDLHYQYMFNVFHLNNGNETFSEIGMMAGMSRTDWSWAPLLADFDNDGYKDLFVTNGLRKDTRNIDWGVNYRNLLRFVSDFNEFQPSQWDMLLNSMPSERVPNYMFQNKGDLTLRNVTSDWNLDQPSWSNGAALGDLDNDGDLDIVVNNVDQEAFVYRNNANDQNYLRIKFIGPEKNQMGLGTKVRLKHGESSQYQQHYISRGYRSSLEPVMHFGLGADTLVNKIEVTWLDGQMQMLENVKANQVLTIRYDDAEVFEIPQEVDKKLYFTDITNELELQVRHTENDMIDYIREPMLPYKLSSLGPALAVADVNRDGLDDFYLGGSFRYAGQMMLQNAEGKFVASQKEFWRADRYCEDMDAQFFDVDADGDLDLYVVSGGNENSAENEYLEDRIYLNDGDGMFVRAINALPKLGQSGSVARPFDIDGDGDLDLFLGGRMIPGQYPLPANSYLLINEGGRFIDKSVAIAPDFEKLGLVTDACWSDFDADGDSDLIIVGEWMPVTVYLNSEGTFAQSEEIKQSLEKTAGWWWSIDALDLDDDGDEDYVLGNIGLNYKFHPSENGPLEIFAGVFDDTGMTGTVFGYYQDDILYPAVTLRKAAMQNVNLRRKFTTTREYALSNLYEIYGQERLDTAYRRQIYEIRSGYLENEGAGKVNFQAFDNYAQISTLNSVLQEDVDRDGEVDLIMAGNLFQVEAETIRNDAGIGVWLRKNEQGSFTSVRLRQSGLYLPHDVRAMRWLPNHASGKSIFLVANNNDYVQAIQINRDDDITLP